jgi:PAS domain S-box-containing protein
MQDKDKTKEQLIAELTEMRQRLQELEALEMERKQAIETLHRSKTGFQTLLESASDGIVIVNTAGRIIFVNSQAEEMFGYRRREVLGHPIEILLPESFRTSHTRHRQQYLDHPNSRPMGVGLDLFGRRQNGTTFPCEVSLSFIETEDQDLVLCMVADISKRKQHEGTLHKRNRDLALLNQAGQTLAATLDSHQVIEQLLQVVNEAIGSEGSSVWLWDPEQPGWLVCQAAFHSDQSRPPVNLRLRPGQGIAGWAAQNKKSVLVSQVSNDARFSAEIDAQIDFHTHSLLAVPLQVRNTVIGVLEVVNKLDGNFNADDQALIETLAASAAVAIDNARLVEALRQHTEELKARNEELDAYAHTVAHDLKNPLALVIGFAQALAESHTILSPQDLRQYLLKISENGQKLRNIIDELLLLASVRKTEIELKPLDMASIVAAAQERLSYQIQEHQAEIILPQTWPVALGHAAWIEEAWVNYLSNAIKYGGQPPRVELGASIERNGSVRFWIRDNGPGIRPEDQARLFTPFTQLHQVRAQGHGLGLSIVRRIVGKLNGQVSVESQVGQGSVFSFTLPRATGSPQSQ